MRGFFEALQDFVDAFDELVAQTRTPLLIPERSGTDLGASFRMKFDVHDDRRVRQPLPGTFLLSQEWGHFYFALTVAWPVA